jgi:DNA helicase HerA-like ATPase
MLTRVARSEPPPHRATSARLQAVYPFMSEAGLGGDGPVVGRDLLGGGSFCFDPWALYRRGLVTNPNLLVIGQVGRGKSTFVKSLVWRQIAFGRQAWILDPKGEYGPLASALGIEPLKLQPGGAVRLNPLELAGTAASWDDVLLLTRRRAELVCSLAESSLGRPLTPVERTATELAVRWSSANLDIPTLTDVVRLLLEPPSDLSAEMRMDQVSLAADGRAVAFELRRLVEGDLAGMFDGSTSAGVNLSEPVVVIDLSNVYSSPALPLLMTCATGWMQSVLARRDQVKRLVVLDEAWAILHDVATARWLRSAFKLSRSFGVSNIAVVHRLSDLTAAGSNGSIQQSLAEGLLADSETRVIFGQPPSEAAVTSKLLSLSETERDAVVHLPRGVALWKVGDRSFLVEHIVGRMESSLVDTDAAMREET